MAGDHHNTFFESVALKLTEQEHTVYKMTRYLDPVYKVQSQQGIMLYGIGKHPDKFLPSENEDSLSQALRFDRELL